MHVYSISTLAFRQTPEHRAALELSPLARRPGRYHDRGDPSPLYASSTPEAAMSEFLRQVVRGDLTFAPDDVRRLSTSSFRQAGSSISWIPESVATRASPTISSSARTRALLGVAQRTSAAGTVMGLRAPSAATDGAITFPPLSSTSTSSKSFSPRSIRFESSTTSIRRRTPAAPAVHPNSLPRPSCLKGASSRQARSS